MFERILVPTDLSSESDKVFEYAAALDGLREVVAVHAVEGAALELIRERKFEPEEIVAVHGIEPSGVEARHMPREIKRREEKISEKGIKLREAGVRFRTLVDEGDTIDMKIVELAERENASLIIIGSHGKSPWEEVLYGSVSEKVARRARVPVLVLRYDLFENTSPAALAGNTFRKVLFPTDLKPSSKRVVDLLQLIKPQEVVVLHSVPKEELEEEGEKAGKKKLENVEKELNATGIKTEVVLRYGDVLEDILRAAEDATSVVMASHGKGILKEWLTGSISLNVARKAKVPVLLAHEGDVSF
jgi:nucleotide-binding universal stress UspA family protein